ncbi:MAG: GCN5-related N-acetyltransferase [Rhodospirillales bacterium]|jgi:ribosomal protein S18 acetylase RimI-like enzyme|nr:GCN5-related N-acetyltransferase [Rhodospirillales bacterium]
MPDKIRSVAPSDLELICAHREGHFVSAGHDRADLKPMIDGFRDWLRPRLADKSYFGWIIERDGRPIAGLGMMIVDWPPHPSHPAQDRRGYVLNMYVDPDHWHGGLGQRLMDMARNEAAALGLDYITVHATPRNQPVYQASGWVPTTELGIRIAPPKPAGRDKSGGT